MLLLAFFKLIICIILCHSSYLTVSPNDDAIAELRKAEDYSITISFNCTNTTLNQEEYELLGNGLVYIRKFDVSLNESDYPCQNYSLTICEPEEQSGRLDYINRFNLYCPNVILGQDDFNSFSDGSVYIKKYQALLSKSFYLLQNGLLTICAPERQGSNPDYNMNFNINCLNITLGPEDYELFVNRSVYIKPYKILLNKSFYILKNNTLAICKAENQYGNLDNSFNWNCSTINLDKVDYELFVNGSVYIEKYKLLLNESFYFIENESLTICKPAAQDGNPSHNKSFDLDCSNTTLSQGDYELLANGSVRIKKYKLLLNESFFLLENDLLTICEPEKIFPCVTQMGIIIGLSALFIHLCVYWYVEDLSSLAFYNCAAAGWGLLFLFFVLMMLRLDGIADDQSGIWYTIPTYTHFFMLTSFSWLSILSTEIVLVCPRFSVQTRQLQVVYDTFSYYSYKWLNFWCVAKSFTYLSGAMIHFPLYVSPEEDRFCWISMREPSLTLLTGQVFFLFGINIITASMDLILNDETSIAMRVGTFSSGYEYARKTLRKSHLLFFKISMAFNVTWIIGALAAIPAVSWLYCVFVFFHIVEAFCLIFCTLSLYKMSRELGCQWIYGFDPETAERSLTDCQENPSCDLR